MNTGKEIWRIVLRKMVKTIDYNWRNWGIVTLLSGKNDKKEVPKKELQKDKTDYLKIERRKEKLH